MLTKISARLDKFYLIFAVLLIVLAVVVIATLRGVFGAVNKANQVDDDILTSDSVRISEPKLNQAIEALKNQKHTPLDLH